MKKESKEEVTSTTNGMPKTGDSITIQEPFISTGNGISTTSALGYTFVDSSSEKKQLSAEEKLMAIQTIGKVLEAQYPYSKYAVDGKPEFPPMPRSLISGNEREILVKKIVELVKSI
jgi:hypothetical protein